MTGSIPSHIKSVSIPEFQNETAEYGIEQRITNLIIDVQLKKLSTVKSAIS